MADSAAQQRVRSQLLELRVKFIERTLGEVALIQRQLALLNQAQSVDLAAILAIAHKIHGGGATLGLPRLSERAAQIEQLLSQSIASDDWPLDAHTCAQLSMHAEQLSAEVAAAAAARAAAPN